MTLEQYRQTQNRRQYRALTCAGAPSVQIGVSGMDEHRRGAGVRSVSRQGLWFSNLMSSIKIGGWALPPHSWKTICTTDLLTALRFASGML